VRDPDGGLHALAAAHGSRTDLHTRGKRQRIGGRGVVQEVGAIRERGPLGQKARVEASRSERVVDVVLEAPECHAGCALEPGGMVGS